MAAPNLTGKRVLVLGAETELGGEIATELAEAGASVAVVSSTSDAEAAFAVQRLARRLSSGETKVISQAIDATNEKAVQVMARQVAKELGGLDGVVALVLREGRERGYRAIELAEEFAGKELDRTGNGRFVLVTPGDAISQFDAFVIQREGQAAKPPLPSWRLDGVAAGRKSSDAVAREVVAKLAGALD